MTSEERVAPVHGQRRDEPPSVSGGRLTIDELSALARAGDIDTVLCVMPDLFGRLVGKRVTPRMFVEIASGHESLHASLYLFVVDIDMNPRPGYQLTSWDDGFGDCRLVPDLATLRKIPWLSRTALVICDPFEEHGDAPVLIAPRNILKRQLSRYEELKMLMKCAAELEFYVFTDNPRDAWSRRYRDLAPLSYFRADYHILQSTKDDWLLKQLRTSMEAAGIEIEFSKAEWGLGQQEVNLRYAGALEMADRHVLYKNGVKEIVSLASHSVTFMAKPFIGEVGSSCHVHSSLWSTEHGDPLFAEDGESTICPLLGHYLAGQSAFGRELAVLFAPNVNSFKRFQPGQFAGTNLRWGLDNRTCGLRVVGEGPSRRLEHRIAGADANPYLVIAGVAAAGIEGIARQLSCPAEELGNAADCAPADQMPTNFRDAIELFAGSQLARRAFGDEVFDHLVNFYRQELAAFDREAVTDWELLRYFERV